MTLFRATFPDDLRGRLDEGLPLAAWRAPQPTSERSAGWCDLDVPLESADPALRRWDLDGVRVALGWGITTRTVDARTLKDRCRLAEEEWCFHHDKRKCPGSVRKEIKEQERHILLVGAPTKRKVVAVYLDPAAGVVLVDSGSSSVVDEVAKKLRDLGITLTRQSPQDLLRFATLGIDEVGALGVPSDWMEHWEPGERVLRCDRWPTHLSSGLDDDFAPAERLILAGPGSTATHRGCSCSDSVEVAAGIAAGGQVAELALTWEGHGHRFTLGTNLVPAKVRLPSGFRPSGPAGHLFVLAEHVALLQALGTSLARWLLADAPSPRKAAVEWVVTRAWQWCEVTGQGWLFERPAPSEPVRPETGLLGQVIPPQITTSAPREQVKRLHDGAAKREKTL
jgi:hypothetical protein